MWRGKKATHAQFNQIMTQSFSRPEFLTGQIRSQNRRFSLPTPHRLIIHIWSQSVIHTTPLGTHCEMPDELADPIKYRFLYDKSKPNTEIKLYNVSANYTTPIASTARKQDELNIQSLG